MLELQDKGPVLVCLLVHVGSATATQMEGLYLPQAVILYSFSEGEAVLVLMVEAVLQLLTHIPLLFFS